jgi:hypothetical protein
MNSRYLHEKCQNCGQSKILCRKYRVTPTVQYRVTMGGTTVEERRRLCAPLPQPKTSKLMCDKIIWAKILR